MITHAYFMTDSHDDLEVVSRGVDRAMAEGLDGSILIHGGDLSLRPYSKDSLDIFLATGDKKRFIDEKRKHNRDILHGYAEIFHNSGIRHWVIPGNYDPNLREVFGEHDIHNRAVEVNGLKIAGYGGGGNLDDPWIGPKHIHRLVELGEIQMFDPRELETLLETENPQIAVIHNPPYGHCDEVHGVGNVGTHTSAKYMKQCKGNLVVLSGHIHIPKISGMRKEDGKLALVVNAGNMGRDGVIDPETLEFKREYDHYGTFARVDIESDGRPLKITKYSVKDNGWGVKDAEIVEEISIPSS